MARPRKCRKVCCLPGISLFGPAHRRCSEAQLILMTVEEYEAIRLIDYQGFTQEECGRYMQIARTTVQQIYNDARKKLSQSLVEGRFLQIEGGTYTLCDGREDSCDCGGCQKHRTCSNCNNKNGFEKRRRNMRIGVTYENGNIFQHFGHTENVKFYDITDGKITGSEVISAIGSGHSALATFLSANKANVLICGGIGGCAITALGEAGIELCAGVSGSADDAVEAYLAGTLQYVQQANCSHHHSHETGGDCGEHSCH